ncbi:MAG TPA: branched-chain amino acid ABC transporter permease/ATP-binding protein [Solirubrobacteraceae bacterium]|nr:branched-chain amino acid ABC transporter permease/ATP-binding protein [Solirubrobacteraceae bacterium]
MKQIVLFILLGLGPGALIAGIALGVVLSYRGAGVINLATGAIAMVSGYAFWALRTDQLGVQMSTGPALLVGLAFVAAVGVAVELIAWRPLRTASPLAKLVSSLGVLLIAQAAVVLAFGTTPQNEPGVLPQTPVSLLGAVIPVDRFILTGIVVAAAAALAALYRWSRFGLATRAASENQVAAMLGGMSPNRLSLANTLIASLVAGGLGILAASITELDSETLPLQIVPALAAALLARFTSFAIACAAGIALGIIDSLIQYVSALSWFPTSGGIAVPGVQELVAFVIIIGAMFLRGGRLPGRGDLIEQRLPLAPRPRNLVPTAAVVGLVCAVGLVVLPYDFREALINTLIGTVMALSLVVLTGFVGQISVVQLTLAGVAGFVISHFAVNFGIGFPLAPIIGTAVAVALGMITAVSALRVRGVALAVVTLAAAVAIQNFGFLNPTWGGGQAGSPVPEPHLLGLDLGPRSAFHGLDGNLPSPVFGWMVLVITLLLCVLVGTVRRGDLGRRMLAVRSNERAAAAASINPRNVKLAAFAISALVAGTAGSLYAYNFGSVSADRFDAFTALSLIAFAYAGGITLISGAAFAGLISTQALFSYALDKWFGLSGTWFLLFGGVILIVTLIQNPEGVAGAFYRRTHRRGGRDRFSPELPKPAARAPVAASSSPPRGESDPPASPASPVLSVIGLSVDFGGVHALSDVDLQVDEGELLGLIGPNGAGKTTFIDAITGFVRCSGRVELDGRDVGGLAPHERARLGFSRTWQGTDLFDDLDVRENLTVAVGDRGGVVPLPGGTVDEVDATLSELGLGPIAAALPSELSEGQRKLVGLARAVVGAPRLLCLDEPAAGLDIEESRALGHRLRELCDRGISTLLIDHDMGLVLSICDRVVVLEFGTVIADGSPEAVRRDPAVIAAYLGSAATPAQVVDPAP